MNDISSRAIDAKAFVTARLSEMEDALDGFPAAVLLDDFLALEGGDDAVDRRAQGLCEHILTRWATTIERDLELFSPATIDVLQDIRQRAVIRPIPQSSRCSITAIRVTCCWCC